MSNTLISALDTASVSIDRACRMFGCKSKQYILAVREYHKLVHLACSLPESE